MGPGRYLTWVIGTEFPDRVDLKEGAHESQHAKDHEKETAGLGRVYRKQRVTHDILLGASGARVLSVLVVDDQREVSGH